MWTCGVTLAVREIDRQDRPLGGLEEPWLTMPAVRVRGDNVGSVVQDRHPIVICCARSVVPSAATTVGGRWMASDLRVSMTRTDAPSLREGRAEQVSPLLGAASHDGKGAAEAFGLILIVAEGLPAISAALTVIGEWLRGSQSPQNVTVEVQGHKIVLGRASKDEQAKLVQAFVDSLPAS